MITDTIRSIIVTGFMDAGKTTFIQNLVFEDSFYKRENGKTLILVFEEGQEEYDIERLKEYRADVVFWDGEDVEDFLTDAVLAYTPDRILAEANCMMPELLDALVYNLAVLSVTMLIDASTLDGYYRNMLQLLQDMVQSSDPIIINRAESKEELEPYATPFRLMNPQAGFLWENEEGYEEVFGKTLPYDLSQQHIVLTEDDFPVWYLDALEYPEHYEGKTVELDVQAFEVDSDDVDRQQEVLGNYIVGRSVMTCCENDIQFLGFWLNCPEDGPVSRSFIHLTATCGLVLDPEYQRNRMLLTAVDLHTIPYPSRLVLSV